MMREIKFRAWDGKKMHLRAMGADISPANSEFGIDLPESYSPYWSTVSMLALMQFTGLHDKNGVPIYEGDIIQSAYEAEAPEEHERGVVEYGRFNCSCCGGVYGWSISNDKADLRNVGPDSDPSLTVIGNVYENPELLIP